MVRVQYHKGPLVLYLLRDFGHDLRVGGTPYHERYRLLRDVHGPRLGRLVVYVDGNNTTGGIHLTQDGCPKERASAFIRARLDDVVGLHLGDDLLNDPGIIRILQGSYPKPVIDPKAIG